MDELSDIIEGRTDAGADARHQPLRKLLDHAPAVRYLSQHHGDILAEFQRMMETPDLKG